MLDVDTKIGHCTFHSLFITLTQKIITVTVSVLRKPVRDPLPYLISNFVPLALYVLDCVLSYLRCITEINT